MNESTQRYAEITAAFAMSPEVEPRFELLLGFHPEEQRRLHYDEDPFLFLRYVNRRDLLSIRHPQGIEKLALLWLKLFPEIDDYLSNRGIEFENLTKKIFEDVVILDLAYAFYPTQFYDKNGKELLKKEHETRHVAHDIQREIEEKAFVHSQAQGKITWTLPFPADGPLGRVTEHKAGLTATLKQRLGLNNYVPGLLCNFLLHRNISIEQILDPHQFEDLTGMIFREEGWNVTRMRQTRDGGKDIIAKQVIAGTPTIAYIQAKMYAEKKVGIREVKEFVATVAGDKVDKGFIVTTSYFSRPSITWLQTKGVSLATIELVDRTQLETRIQKIADAEIAAYHLH